MPAGDPFLSFTRDPSIEILEEAPGDRQSIFAGGRNFDQRDITDVRLEREEGKDSEAREGQENVEPQDFRRSLNRLKFKFHKKRKVQPEPVHADESQATDSVQSLPPLVTIPAQQQQEESADLEILADIACEVPHVKLPVKLPSLDVDMFKEDEPGLIHSSRESSILTELTSEDDWDYGHVEQVVLATPEDPVEPIEGNIYSSATGLAVKSAASYVLAHNTPEKGIQYVSCEFDSSQMRKQSRMRLTLC